MAELVDQSFAGALHNAGLEEVHHIDLEEERRIAEAGEHRIHAAEVEVLHTHAAEAGAVVHIHPAAVGTDPVEDAGHIDLAGVHRNLVVLHTAAVLEEELHGVGRRNLAVVEEADGVQVDHSLAGEDSFLVEELPIRLAVVGRYTGQVGVGPILLVEAAAGRTLVVRIGSASANQAGVLCFLIGLRCSSKDFF